MRNEKYDVVIIGSGPAGGTVARKCRKAGLSVAVVERDGWGGVCPLRGCEPKKVLVDAAHTVFRFRDMSGLGPVGEAGIDWPSLMKFKRSLIDPISPAVFKSYEKAGIKTVPGEGAITEDRKVAVEGYGVIEGRDIVIATGARPRKQPEDDAGLVIYSDQFLELDEIPQSIAFLGGGFISIEYAFVAAAAGAEVSVIHRSERILRGFSLKLSQTLLEAMKEAGIRVYMNHGITSLESSGSGVRINTRHSDTDKESSFEVDLAVSAIGRVPNIDGIGLEEAGIEIGKSGIRVNSKMQCVNNPNVYAIGDCAEPDKSLTPTAALHAEVAANNIIGSKSHESDLTGSASAVFSHPPLAAVGLSVEEASEDKHIIHSGDASKWSEHKRLGIKHAGYEVIEDAETGKILGAHYLGQHAEEIINLFGMAIRHGLTRKELLAQPWAYPSFGYALWYMLD